MKRVSGVTALAAAVLVLLPALAWLQYSWLDQIAEADRDRRGRTLQTAASQLAQDLVVAAEDDVVHLALPDEVFQPLDDLTGVLLDVILDPGLVPDLGPAGDTRPVDGLRGVEVLLAEHAPQAGHHEPRLMDVHHADRVAGAWSASLTRGYRCGTGPTTRRWSSKVARNSSDSQRSSAEQAYTAADLGTGSRLARWSRMRSRSASS